MNRQYIKAISIEGFRGINNKGDPLTIEFNKEGITSLFAPNGGGKSSIFDALSYCLNNELKCFKPLERENQDFKTVRNLFHEGNGKIIIKLEDDNLIVNTIEFKIDDTGLKEITSPNKIQAEALINQISDIHNFLDYHSFTDIINTSPENAGKTFLKLIGYEKFSTIQDKLGTLARNIERDYNINTKKIEIKDAQERIKISRETISERLLDIGITTSKFKIKNIITRCESGIKKIVPELSTGSFKEINIDNIITGINSKETAYNSFREELIKNNQENEQLLTQVSQLKNERIKIC
jgi:DNA repair exonuclease SbcCD ATPase subunit